VIAIYSVYIMTNWNGKVMYIGMTNDLERRVNDHKHGLIKGFTEKYNINTLVYFENTNDAHAALAREKQLRGWTRRKKNELVESVNPEWHDLLPKTE